MGEQIVLASGSPRRIQLLEAVGLHPVVVKPHVIEDRLPDESPRELVVRLSRLKARDGWLKGGRQLTLGADTVVALDQQVLGKPGTTERARWMLRKLSGKIHQVLTGVTLVHADGREEAWCSCTEVEFNTLSDKDIDAYLAAVDVLDKAGAYGIQSHGDWIVREYRGLWSNVVGLPVEDVTEHLGMGRRNVSEKSLK